MRMKNEVRIVILLLCITIKVEELIINMSQRNCRLLFNKMNKLIRSETSRTRQGKAKRN